MHNFISLPKVNLSDWHLLADNKLTHLPQVLYNTHQCAGSSLVQVMACRLIGTKPFPEPQLAYYQLDSWEHISVKFESEFYPFHSRKCKWMCHLPKWRRRAFCLCLPNCFGIITNSTHNTRQCCELILCSRLNNMKYFPPRHGNPLWLLLQYFAIHYQNQY